MVQTSGSSKRRRISFRSTGNEGALLFIGSIFCIIGVFASYFLFVGPAMKYVESRSWVAVPAIIDSSQLAAKSDSDGTTYSIAVAYHYEYGGRPYRGDTYDFFTMSTAWRSGKERTIETLRPGTTVTCYVNPKDPSRAVINRWPNEMWFGLLPLAFVAGGLVMMRSGVRARREKTSIPDRLRRPVWLPASVHRDVGGHVILAPTSTRTGSFIAFLVFALFWNGITSVLVIQVVRSHLNGSPRWFLTIFAIPFVLTGLLLIGLAVGRFLAMFNPKIELTLNRAEMSPGDVLHLSWQIDGDVNRLRKLTITLVGEESATYRRGTNTVTDQHVFVRVPVHESEMIGRLGTAKVSIPDDAMHSFKSTNNCITWSLKVAGDVPRWGDVEDEYEVVVASPGMAVHG